MNTCLGPTNVVTYMWNQYGCHEGRIELIYSQEGGMMSHL